MEPPAGAPYPDAFATGYLFGQFLDGDHPKWAPGMAVDVRMHDLPCPTRAWGSDAASVAISSRQFYALYASTSGIGRVRLMSFVTDCQGSNAIIAGPLPTDLPWFSEEITVEIYLETDDGIDGGTLVLVGSAMADS